MSKKLFNKKLAERRKQILKNIRKHNVSGGCGGCRRRQQHSGEK